MGNLLLDASSPAVVYNAAAATVVSASFTPPANSFLIIASAMNSGAGNLPAAPTITDSLGTHLTYTLIQHSSRSDSPATDGQAAMWRANVVTSAAMTITVTNNDTATGQAIKVWVFTDDAGGTPSLGAQKESGRATAGTAVADSVTATVNGSRGLIVYADQTPSVTVPTAGTGCTLTGGGAANQDGTLTYAFALRSSADGVAASAISMNLTTGSTSTNRWVIAEVVPGVSPAAGASVGLDTYSWWPGDGPGGAERFVADPVSADTPPFSKVNTFDGGTAGTAITTANSATGDDPFTFISVPTGGSATYQASGFRGAGYGQVVIGSTTGLAYLEQATGINSAGRWYGRIRFRLPLALPPDATGYRFLILSDSVGAFQVDARIINTGALELRTGAGTLVGTTTKTYAVGEWADVGISVLTFSATAGQIQMVVYDTDAVTPLQTITSGTTLDTLRNGGLSKAQAGIITSGRTNTTIDLDDYAQSTGTYPALPPQEAAATLASVSTIAPSAVTISGTFFSDALVTPGTIAPPVVTISGAARAGAVAVVSTVAPAVVTVTGAGSAQAGSVVTVSTVAPPAVVVTGAGSAQAGAVATVSTVAPSAVTVSGTPALAVLIAPGTIAPVKVAVTGTAQTGSTVTVSTISPVKVAVSGTAQAGAVAVVSTVAPSVVTVSGSALTGSTATPGTVSPPAAAVSGTAQAGAVALVSTVAPPVAAVSGTASAGSTAVVVSVAPPVVVISGSPSQAVQAATVAPPVVVVSGTGQAGAVPVVSTIAPVKVTISGTPALAVLITPATVLGTVAIGPHPAAAGSKVTVTTVAPGVVVVSGSGSAGATVTPATIAPSVVVISGLAGAVTQVPVSTLSPTVVVVSGTASAGATATVVTVSPVKVAVSGTALTGSAASPATVLGAVTLGAVTVTTVTAVSPATILGAVAVSGTAFTSALVAASTVSPSVVVISGTASVSKTVTVVTVIGTVGVGTVALSARVLVPVTTVSGSVAIGPHLLRTGAAALVATILGLATIPTPTFTSGYVTPGDDATVIGQAGYGAASGTLLPTGVTGDVLPPAIGGTNLTAGVI